MKCKTLKRRRQREKRWQRNAFKELGKNKRLRSIQGGIETKIGWFEKLIAWLKAIFKKLKGRFVNKTKKKKT